MADKNRNEANKNKINGHNFMGFYNKRTNYYDFEIFLGGNDQEDFKWSFFIFAKSYFYIANNFAKKVISGEEKIRDYLCYPVFFNYRHFFELSLKGCIHVGEIISRKQNFINGKSGIKTSTRNNSLENHCLQPLANNAIEKLEAALGRSSMDIFKEFIIKISKEIDEIDKNSMLFRYPTDTKGQKQLGAKGSNFNLVEIQKTFEEASEIFETISFGLSATDYMVDEHIREVYYNDELFMH